MSRYVICSEWTPAFHQPYEPFIIQDADLRDTRNGSVYTDGAKRVIDSRTGKRVGPVFKGESAWAAAERQASDSYLKVRYGR
jgi:hypothetical protein